MSIPRGKNPAAVALGVRGGRAGRGEAKRRGDSDYYRGLVARRSDRRAETTAMAHRHLSHQEFTLAAIDDVIGRGKFESWLELRRAVSRRSEIAAKVMRVCAAHAPDAYAQRYHFWRHYVEERQGESVAGWRTARVRRPVQILGSLDGIETCVRQLIRNKPLETKRVRHQGQVITVPTDAEMLRIKAVLILKRNATRDYLDFVALQDRLGAAGTLKAMQGFDRLYPQPNGESALQQLLAQLAEPRPYDLEETRLTEYKRLAPRWQTWGTVREACARCATALFERLPPPA